MGKKILILSITVMFIAQLCYAQSDYIWVPMQSNTTSNLRYHYLNYAAGDNATILRTTGSNWEILNSGGNFEVRDIYQFGTYIAVGTNGNILFSTNAGTTWFPTNSPVSDNLNSISRGINLPILVFTAVGDNGIIITSTNSGIDWQVRPSPSGANFNSIFYSTVAAGNYGVIVGDGGIILKTTNVGTNWNNINSGTTQNLNDIYFLFDNTTGWICGDNGVILKTTNSGDTWTQFTGIGNFKLNSIYFFDLNTGYVCGEDGLIFRTTDGGSTWTIDNNFSTVNLYAIYAISENSVRVVGDNGTILNRVLNPITLPYYGFSPNNLKAWIHNNALFNRGSTAFQSGLEWPTGSDMFVCFSSGLSVIGNVSDSLRMFSVAYDSELKPGYTVNGNYFTDSTFMIYRVKSTDSVNNFFWQNWGFAVQYGAPFVDVNNNGVYDPGIDIPGVKDASETVFLCLSDADRNNTPLTGWAGRSLPLGAQVQLTMWGYDQPGLNSVHFLEFKIINKSKNNWEGVYYTLYSDADIGYAVDDYPGCDSILNLGYGYNATPIDGSYGSLPPAVGFQFLKTPVHNNKQMGLTSFFNAKCNGCPLAIQCEVNPNTGDMTGAYNFARGFKKDGTPWVIPNTDPPVVTKFNYSGDPETQTGWTAYNGKVMNCGGSLTGDVINEVPPGDIRIVLNSGHDEYNIQAGDTHTVVLAQMVAQGINNRNSVTKLKELAANVNNFFYNNQSLENQISGTVRYGDNNQFVTEGHVKALRLDKLSGDIEVLDSVQIGSNGQYHLPNVPIDSVYIVAYPNSKVKADFIPTYYPASVYWSEAIVLFPIVNLTDVNVSVVRSTSFTGDNSVTGNVYYTTNDSSLPMKDAVLFAKSGNEYIKFDITEENGNYGLQNLPNGKIYVVADRIGFSRDSLSLSLTGNMIVENINFTLHQIYVNVNNISEEIPGRYKLYQNYPNPFNPVTKIKFELPQSYRVSLKVFDVLGREVAELTDQRLHPGVYEFTFDASGLSSGIYFYRLETKNYIEVRRMVLLK